MPAVNKKYNTGVVNARRRLEQIIQVKKDLDGMSCWTAIVSPRDVLIAQVMAEARAARINPENLPVEIRNASAEIVAELVKRKSSIIGKERTKNAVRAAIVRGLKGMRPIKAGKNVARIVNAPKKKFMTNPIGYKRNEQK